MVAEYREMRLRGRRILTIVTASILIACLAGCMAPGPKRNATVGALTGGALGYLVGGGALGMIGGAAVGGTIGSMAE